MPVLTLQEIQDLVNGDRVKGVTLDTSVFDQFGCNLEYKQLTALEQFRPTKVRFVLSEVIIGEVTRHIETAAGVSAEKAREALNQYLKAWRSKTEKTDIYAVTGLNQDATVHANSQIRAYLDKTGVTVISSESGVSVAELMKLYFASAPPFANESKKKNEFPDAIALLSLEAWASESGGYLLAISRDEDWKAFADTSERVLWINDLPAGLNLFNSESSAVAHRIGNKISDKKMVGMVAHVERALVDFVQEFQIEAHSQFRFGEEIVDARIISWNVVPNTDFPVISSDSSSVTFALSLYAEVQCKAFFTFSAYVSEDGIDIQLGATLETAVAHFYPTVLVTIEKDDVSDQALPYGVEIEDRQLRVDFGEVGPDW